MAESPCNCAFIRPFKDADEEVAWRQTHDLHIRTKEVFDKLMADRGALLTKKDLAGFEERLGKRIDSIVGTVQANAEAIAALKAQRNTTPTDLDLRSRND
jgi:hypothetical protein